MPASVLSIDVPQREISALVKACHRLGDAEMPFLRPTFQSLLGRLAGDIGGRAPASFKVSQKGVSVTKGSISAKGSVSHAGARSREFGRVWYWTAYVRRSQRSGTRVRRRGQRARPFVGVKPGSGGAMGALAPHARSEILEAVAKEWARNAAN